MSMASEAADLANNDGRQFPEAFEAMLEKAIRDQHGQSWHLIRYTFADGSIITASDSAWDFGYPDCYCWKGGGHYECSAEGVSR